MTRTGFALHLTSVIMSASLQPGPGHPAMHIGYTDGLHAALQLYFRATDPDGFEHAIRDAARAEHTAQSRAAASGQPSTVIRHQAIADGLLSALGQFWQAGSPL